jgi:hypothetical protein
MQPKAKVLRFREQNIKCCKTCDHYRGHNCNYDTEKTRFRHEFVPWNGICSQYESEPEPDEYYCGPDPVFLREFKTSELSFEQFQEAARFAKNEMLLRYETGGAAYGEWITERSIEYSDYNRYRVIWN